jgi:hypothetical protein
MTIQSVRAFAQRASVVLFATTLLFTASVSPARAAAPSNITVASATGEYGSDVDLTATLTSGMVGVAGVDVEFFINALSVGIATTDVNGVATLSNESILGIDAGTHSVTASFAGDINYDPSSDSDDLEVTPVELTVTGLNAENKVYNSNANAVITGTPVLGAGVVGLDEVSLTGVATGSFSDKDVDTGKTVTITGLSLTGADAGNYELATLTDTADITPFTLTATATADDKVYDGNTNASNVVSINKFSGDAVTATGTGVFDTKDAGNGKLVTVSSITLSGADSGNYTLGNTTATTTADIDLKELTANVTISSKEYDGTDSATIFSIVTVGVVGVEDVFIAGGTATYNDENVGNGKTVNVTGMAVGGADYINYSFAGTAVTTGDITTRAITVTAQTDTKVYDGTTSSGVEPLITSGTLAVGDTEGFSQTFSTADVGTGKTLTATGVVNDGNGGNNYAVSFVTDTTGVITKAPLTITADDLTKVYGDANPVATASYSGFVGGDDASDLDTGVTLVVVANDQTDVNNHPITAFGASDSNYEITHVNGNLEITKRPITVTVNASGKLYDASDSATATLTPVGVLFSDVVTASQTSTTFSDANVGVGKTVTASGITLGGADAGNYSVAATATGSADITIRSVSVTADAKSKVYGESDPSLTYQITSGTLAGSDDFSGALSRDLGEDFGTYAINQGTLTLGGNYDLTYTGANLSITPATLTVTADDKTKVYGETNPSLTVSYSGFQNGDDASDLDTAPTANTSAVDDSDVGTYAITASGGADANYTFSYVDGELEVTPLAITVTVDASDKVYDATDTASVVLTPDGLLFGDAVTAGYTIASFSDANVGTGKDVDVSGVFLSGVDAGNYSVAATATGSADITKKMLTVTADDKSKSFGAVNPTLTVSYAGFEGGEDESVLNTTPDIETTALTGSDVGTYPIVADDASDNNYDFSYVDGVLTIVQADQTITFGTLADKNFGDADFTVSATAESGLDVTFAASGACTISGDTVTLTTKGTCTITASQSGDSNWNAASDVAQSFTVFDVTAPVITLTGDASITHDLQSPYVDEGATALDDVDGVVAVTVTNPVDPNTVGTYYVTYDAVDAEGNVAGTVTRTVEVVAATTNTGGGGGGNGGTVRRITTPSSNGSVLGASVYNFTVDMTIGSTGNDVIELQKRLRALGFFTYPTDTGYFGPLTQAAVKLYQASKGIITTGYVGPLTRGALNSSI